MTDQFERSVQALGREAFERLQQARVILFGVGGVGGWCAESLVRTGIQHLTIVDCDVVDATNINRQIVATSANIGHSKVEEMRQRLLTINPQADIVALHQRYTADTADSFHLADYDCILDAIDSIPDKVHLLYTATRTDAVVISSMGAGRKRDTEQIRLAEFWKVEGCPLARALRQRIKKENLFPAKKFTCVYSPEISSDSGTLAPIVGVFGMKMAAAAIQHLTLNS